MIFEKVNKTVREVGMTVGAIVLISGFLLTVGNATGYRPVMIKELEPTLEQLKELSDSVLLLRFQKLQEKRDQGGLMFYDMQEYCKIGQALAFLAVDGCGNMTTSRGPAPPTQQ